jgi:hypothetical protein
VAAKKYIRINEASTNYEERDLRNDVGEFAYVDWGELDAPFDTHSLKIGSHSFVGADWTDVQHAPSVLPAGGHFQVFTADNSIIVLYTVSVASSVKNSCFLTRSARLVITDGVAENWVYFAQGTTQKFGRIRVASEYDGGMATEMKHEVYGVDFINQYAFLDRGSLTQKINFNTVVESGRYRIENVGGWVSKGSLNYPPTDISTGYLEVTKNNCSVFQKFYPDDANRTGLLFREKSETGNWSSWFTATEGNMMIGTDKVYVPTDFRRGVASGYAKVPVYSAAASDRKYTYTQGYGISIVDNVISWVGSIGLETDPIYTGSSWYYTVNNASNWNTAYSWGNFALRNLTVQGAAGRVSVSGGMQSLGADRIWSVDLTPVHTGLSGGSATQVPGLNVDAYGRVTVMNNIPINFPVTSVNGQTGAVSLTTTNIPEGTNLYWTVARGDARYSLLGHTHTWNDVSNKPLTFTPSAHTHPYTEVTGITAGTGITYTGGVIASTITQYTNAMARAAISAGGLLSYNSTTGVMSLATVPWTSVTGAPDFSGVPLTRALTVAGTNNNIVVSGGTQTLGADRTWTVDLVPIHANPLSGGSATQVAYFTTDVFGRVTGVSNVAISYPVTSVNGQTGAVSLTTTNIPEGTNLYWTVARGDARYSLLGHTHTWNDISGKPVTFAPSAHTHPYTEVTGITAGTGITYTGGVIASTITQYTDPMARAAISAGGLLSYNSTTGVMSLATVPWTSVTGAPDFSAYVPLTRAITVAGTTNNIVVSGGTQTLGADRTWTVDLVPIHANPLSGGSGFQVPGLNVDRNGRVTALTNISITYPVTSVNAQTGAVSLNTDNIAEGTTNRYFTDARARAVFSAGTSISISAGGVISYTGAAGLTGSGTLNYVPKFSGSSALTNSQIYDDGTAVGIGTASPGPFRFRVNGAIYADGDVSAVAMYLGSGQAIRVPVGNMFIDSPSGVTYFRTTGYAYSMTLSGPNVLMGTITVNGSRTLQVVGGIRSTGQMQLADYTASTSYSGTAAALLGTDSGGNVITISTDRYAPLVHNHNGDYYTKSQVDGFLSGKADWGHTHTIAQVTGLQSALDGKTPWGHTHTIAEVTGLQGALDNRPTWGDVYTRTQLNTSGAGGAVHWDNVTNKPATYAPSYHRTNWSDVDGAPAFLTSFTESDPFGFDSHWFSTSGSNVTLGVQRRNGTQAFASFSVPSTSSNYSLNLSPFTSGLGHHVFNLVKSGGGGNSVDLFEQDPKGIAYVQLQKSGSNLTIIITRRDLTTATDTIAI